MSWWQSSIRALLFWALAVAANGCASAIGYPIPNPGVLFSLTVFYGTYAAGRVMGFVCGGLSMLYMAWFFAIPGRPFQYDPIDVRRMLTILVTVCLIPPLIGRLRDRAISDMRLEAEKEQQDKIIAALRESEDSFRILTEATREGVLLYEWEPPNVRFLAVNDALLRMHQCVKEDFLLTDGSRFLTAESLALAQEAPPAGPEHVIELTGVRTDGSTFPLECCTRRLPWKGREIFVRTVRDLTERKESERSLRESETRFRRLFQSHIIGVVTAYYDGRIEDANDAFLRMTGYSRQDLEAPFRWHALTTPETRSRDEAALQTLASQSEGMTWESQLVRKDGSRLPVMAGAVALDDSGGRFIGFVLDLSLQKQQQAAVMRLSGQVLAAQDQERRRIARDLHDSTAPKLAAVVSLLRGGAHPAMQEAAALQQEVLDEIRTLSYLLHPPLLDELGLRSALRTYLAGFSKRSGVQATLEVAEEIGRMDADMEIALFRIVQEGVANVHRHSSSATVQVRLFEEGGRTRLVIEDEGRGFNANQAGVGMASMRERAQLLGGSFDIHSDAQGTRLSVSLPAPEAA